MELFSASNKPRVLLAVSLLLIAVLFFLSATVTYRVLYNNALDNEWASQQRMTQILNELFGRYFNTFKFITINTVLQPEFAPELTEKSGNKYLYQRVNPDYAKKVVKKEGISNILLGPRKSSRADSPRGKSILSHQIANWQIYKALPDKAKDGKELAPVRRRRADS